MIVVQSASTYAETTESLIAAIERRGLSVFARIDHAAAAREAGLELEEEEVVLFGNASGGTPLMQSDRKVGIELPLRILIWRQDRVAWLAYNDLRELNGPYDWASHQPTLEQMAKLLNELTAEAAR